MNVSVKNLCDFTVSLSSYAVPHIEGLNYEVSADTSNVLPTLDPSGIVYNPNEKALVVMITMQSTVDTTASLALKANQALSFGVDNAFSNCIKITPATLGGTSPQIATREADASSRSFVTVTDGTPSKVESIPLVDSIEMRANEEITLCFVIEYYELAVSALFAGARNNNAEVHEMNFTNDVEFIIDHVE